MLINHINIKQAVLIHKNYKSQSNTIQFLTTCCFVPKYPVAPKILDSLFLDYRGVVLGGEVKQSAHKLHSLYWLKCTKYDVVVPSQSPSRWIAYHLATTTKACKCSFCANVYSMDPLYPKAESNKPGLLLATRKKMMQKEKFSPSAVSWI